MTRKLIYCGFEVCGLYLKYIVLLSAEMSMFPCETFLFFCIIILGFMPSTNIHNITYIYYINHNKITTNYYLYLKIALPLRYLLIVVATVHMLGLDSSDVMYNTLPLYHTAGGVVGTGAALVDGIPSVLRAKFSASNYWTDCIKYNCTVGHELGA